jgi:hypothetical protein
VHGEAPHFVLGHADAELERLRLQSAIYAGVTRRLIRECGIAPDRLPRAS